MVPAASISGAYLGAISVAQQNERVLTKGNRERHLAGWESGTRLGPPSLALVPWPGGLRLQVAAKTGLDFVSRSVMASLGRPTPDLAGRFTWSTSWLPSVAQYLGTYTVRGNKGRGLFFGGCSLRACITMACMYDGCTSQRTERRLVLLHQQKGPGRLHEDRKKKKKKGAACYGEWAADR